METFNTCLLNNGEKSTGKKALGFLVRMVGLGTILILALAGGGCLVSNDEFDKARLQRDGYLRESQLVHQSNDALKREISEIYESCDLISTQLTVLAAMNLHDQYTAGLSRPRPVLPPPLPTRNPTAASGQTRRPATNQGVTSPRRQQGATQNTGTGGTRRPASGGQSGRPGGGGSSPAPQPSPSPGGGGGGSIDWGGF